MIGRLPTREHVRYFCQDSWQWDYLHAGCCTTSQCPSTLGFFGSEIWGHRLSVRTTSPCAKFPHMTCHIVCSPRQPISSAFQRACNGVAQAPETDCGRLRGAIRAWESWRPHCVNDVPRPTTTTTMTTMTNACGPGGLGWVKCNLVLR
jgi:hypothetical protein